MRLRRASVAVLGAFTLLLAVPSSASAATGLFEYSYVGLDGRTHHRTLLDPDSGECITIAEAADPNSQQPAHSPHNRTTATATVFTEPDCSGDYFTLRILTGRGGERLKFRSVVFS
ncbi:hypothetical protein ACFWAR_19435 [Streptomyces sp. NPDC059917]|uniref:hypothetical protein n=1 Tax=Streptomyces sp. NPDC059917 TaxID=3347002 RepID=UPI00365D96E3